MSASLIAAAVSGSPVGISVEAALILLLTGTVVYCVRLISDLRRQLSTASGLVCVVPATSQPAHTASAPPAQIAGLAPEVLAAIAAAVHVTLGGRLQIRAIIATATSVSPAWSLEGRREVFHSHRPR